MIRSSIDLGTNTCLLLIADWDDSRQEVDRVVEDHSTIVRLGQGVDRSRLLAEEAVERTLACLHIYSERIRSLGLDPATAVAVATATARDASNGAEFFARVEKETGFRFRTLSGEEEARSTFLGGLLPGMDPSRSAVIDIGGGSTELMSRSGGLSVDLGSVRFTERFLKSDPVLDAEFWACQEAVDQALSRFLPIREQMAPDTDLVAVAGTATTLGAYFLGLAKFDAPAINEVILSRGDVHRMVEELKWRSHEERKRLAGVESGRADVLLAGALILWRAMELLQFPKCRVSTRGLRFGVFATPTEMTRGLDPGSS